LTGDIITQMKDHDMEDSQLHRQLYEAFPSVRAAVDKQYLESVKGDHKIEPI
jgi:hypothetical protein